MSSSGLDTVHENLRLQQVYATMVNFGAAATIERTPFGPFRRKMQRWIYQVPEPIPDLSDAQRTRIMLEGLGPTYVKLGQIVSSQASTLPDDWRIELERLQNEVPPAPYSAARQVIIDELGAPPEELFATFEKRPLAAASLGQVHRATLHDGREVAVKVQRPNLQKMVKADLGRGPPDGSLRRASQPDRARARPRLDARRVRLDAHRGARLLRRGLQHGPPRQEHGADRRRPHPDLRAQPVGAAGHHPGVRPRRQDLRRRRDARRRSRHRRRSATPRSGPP